MKKMTLVLALTLSLSLVGCGQTEAPASSEADQTVETTESTETLNTEDSTEASDSTVTEEAEEDDGSYWLSGHLLSSEKDKSGEPDENGNPQPIVYVAKIDGDSFIVEGATNMRQKESDEAVEMGPGDSAEFIITDETVFQMCGGEDGPETVTKDEFAGYLESCADSGLLLDLQITGAKVTMAKIRA